jgi:hypothetical protein
MRMRVVMLAAAMLVAMAGAAVAGPYEDAVGSENSIHLIRDRRRIRTWLLDVRYCLPFRPRAVRLFQVATTA